MKDNRRQGVLAGGNWTIDFVKMIDAYPEEQTLANIEKVYSSNDGAPYNILKALYKLGADFPLEAVGCVGQDACGAYIMADCRRMNIDVSGMRVLEGHQTSYTDVMSTGGSGTQTSFHFRGVNALLSEEDFVFSKSNAKILYLGYLLKLDKLDVVGSSGESEAAVLFRRAKKEGLITSAGTVSQQTDRYYKLIPPCLPYVDILFLNEYEAEKLTDSEILSINGAVQLDSCRRVADKIIEMGVNKWVVIHFPHGAVAMNPSGEWYYQEALKIPDHKFVGSLGVGDAFAAGVLYGLHDDWPIKDALKLGVSVAASSLMSSGASSGILSMAGCLDLYNEYDSANRMVL